MADKEDEDTETKSENNTEGKVEFNPEQEIELDNKRWKNRRRMAWISLIAMLLVTGAMMFFIPETRLPKLESVVTWFYMAMTSIVGAYMGFTTWQMMQGKK